MVRKRIAASGVAFLLAFAATCAQAQYPYGGYGGDGMGGSAPLRFSEVVGRVAIIAIAALIGFGLGAFFSQKMRRFRRYLWIGIAALVALSTLFVPSPIGSGITGLVTVVAFFVAIGLGLAWGRFAQVGMGGPGSEKSVTFGSARWATADLLRRVGLVGDQGLALGYFAVENKLAPLHYPGDRHLLTVAPTRAGKGVAAIIPNLLTYRGSALVIDPKGENAMVTAVRRGTGDKKYGIEGLGQKVYVVDPWKLTPAVTGVPTACFNPIDWIDPGSPDAGENAMMLADSLVVPAPGGDENPFWAEESKALLQGLILHVATDPAEDGKRNLGRVRDLLMLPAADFEALCLKMAVSSHPIVASTGARTAGKEAKLLSNVLAAVQSHTHFLDSPSLRESLSRSDFKFEDLKRQPTTVYLVLPADRLNTFGRWLRLMIQMAITVTARNITDKPERPILFLLDEMAAIGRLTMVEQAYGLMAGFGMQLWGIVQDLSQLHRIYGDGWQTFIGNSGVLQYFGSRDKMTAEYFSSLCGESTVPNISSTVSKAFSTTLSNTSSTTQGETTTHNHGETQRKLIFPDELMRIPPHIQLLLVESLDPIAALKISWFQDERFKPLGVNIRQLPAASPTLPSPAAAPGQRKPA
jgi:type IV secretion system protein VirD4